jgi:Transposase DNA-binding
MKRHRAHWVETELRSAKLGDRRLDKRLAIIVEAFANLPQASIPSQ